VHVACVGENRDTYMVLARESEWKIPLGSPRRRGENSIKMYPEEIR
jgi:hypothetical protein